MHKNGLGREPGKLGSGTELMIASAEPANRPAGGWHRLAAALLAFGVAVGAGAALAPAVAHTAATGSPMVTPPEKLSWHGDPAAPDISGVWVRVATPTPSGAGASKEGWLPWPPPLKPAYARIWHDRVARQAAGTRTDDPVVGCMPPGMPRFDTGMTTPMLIIQTPGRVMLYRDGIPVRRIWLDGRPMPEARDLESFSNGTAIGHYEAGDLVTKVAGFRDQPIDSTGIPHSGDLVITERFHRVDARTLRVEVVLTDRTAYTKPMKTVVTYQASDNPLWEPHEFLCAPSTGFHPEIYVH